MHGTNNNYTQLGGHAPLSPLCLNMAGLSMRSKSFSDSPSPFFASSAGFQSSLVCSPSCYGSPSLVKQNGASLFFGPDFDVMRNRIDEHFFFNAPESPRTPIPTESAFQKYFENKNTHEVFHPSYSRKVFVGGVPAGTNQGVLQANFAQFGRAHIDWPKKSPGDAVPPEGYVFVVFEDAKSVNNLLKACLHKSDRIIFHIQKTNGSFHPVEIKPWNLEHGVFVGNPGWQRFRSKSIFVGGVPRTVSAAALVELIQEKIGSVAYCHIEQDKTTGYPKGAAHIVFFDRESFIKAVAAHKVTLNFSEGTRKVEIKPFLEQSMPCISCQEKSNTKFCMDVFCLAYYCVSCWKNKHSSSDMKCHEALKKVHGGKKTV